MMQRTMQTHAKDWGCNMKHLLTVFVLSVVSALPLVAAQPKLEYHASITGNYESNIGQNILEVAQGYVTPSVGAKWFPAHGPVYGKIDLSYELHVQDRAPKYNDPLIDIGVGAPIRSGKFRITPELSYALWYANNVVLVSDSARNVRNFVVAQRKALIDLPMKLVFSRQVIEFGVKGSYTDDIGNEYDGIDLSFDPAWSYRFKAKKRVPVQMKSFGVDGSIDLNLAEGDTKKYSQGEISPSLAVRFGSKGSYASLSGNYARRIYGSPISDPQSSDSLKELISLFGASLFLDISVVSDLHIQAGGKLRFRNSNISYDDWDRHTAFVRLKWDCSLGRDSD